MRPRFLVASVALALAGATAATTAYAAEPSATPYIIGGSTVSSAPWAAVVLSNGGFTCSGSTIGANWVLTAKHCVNGTMSVRIGSVNRSSGGVTRNVTASYSRGDLAVLKLNSSVSTTYLPLASQDPPVGSTNNLYGWGMTCRYFCGSSDVLKTATVRVTSVNATDGFGGRAIASTRINGNAWRGDSGGPQVYNGQQVGVASTADGRSSQYYGSVAANRSWITQTTGI